MAKKERKVLYKDPEFRVVRVEREGEFVAVIEQETGKDALEKPIYSSVKVLSSAPVNLKELVSTSGSR